MAGELLKAFIGKTCQITTGQFGSMRGTVTAVDGNWLELTDKKNEKTLFNIDYLGSVKEVVSK